MTPGPLAPAGKEHSTFMHAHTEISQSRKHDTTVFLPPLLSPSFSLRSLGRPYSDKRSLIRKFSGNFMEDCSNDFRQFIYNPIQLMAPKTIAEDQLPKGVYPPPIGNYSGGGSELNHQRGAPITTSGVSVESPQRSAAL